ncbi:MAG: hypothetical protein HYV09_18175 [Deltaproteobacteria bacterium]|nr:hypothetical protein [Deltaproteobacteria bacterium]
MTEAIERFRRTRLPLTAANFVLSIALVIGAARTIGRRPGGLAWLRQVCIATVLYAGIEHVVSREERAWLADRIAVVSASRIDDPHLTRAQAEAASRATARFSFVLTLAAQLALYGGLAIALGRASVIAELTPADGSRRSVPPPSSRDDDS